MHVWDAGIVLHSKALPPFLAALAPAVALAGQDISLMRRVRALIVSSSDGGRGYSAAAGGATMRWVQGCCIYVSFEPVIDMFRGDGRMGGGGA